MIKVKTTPNNDMKLAEALVLLTGREVDIIYKALHEYVQRNVPLFDMDSPEEKSRADDSKKLYEDWENKILSGLTK